MHFRCHLGLTSVSTDKEFFENNLTFKLSNFCIVIGNVHCCEILGCVVNMGGLDRKSVIPSSDLMWCLSKRHQDFCLMFLVSLDQK